jgi:predicted transcriptional regulator of viral defense system
MSRRIGKIEAQLFAYALLRNLLVLRSGDLLEPLGLTKKQERELLDRLNRAGMIAQVQRGLYLLPERLPLGGKWSPDDAQVLHALITEQHGTYQVSGQAAFNFHGFDDQMPNRIDVYNDRLSGTKRVAAIALSMIKVAPERLGSTTAVVSSSGKELVYSSRVRTLVDSVYDWSRFGSLPRGYEWIRQDISAGRCNPMELAECSVAYGDVGTRRRIGYLMAKEGYENEGVELLRNALTATSSTIPWIPGRPKRGSTHRQWGIVDNSE